MTRYAFSLLGAVVVVFGLFWSMQAMISGEQLALSAASENRVLDFIRVDLEQNQLRERQRRVPERPPEETQAPPPPPPSAASSHDSLEFEQTMSMPTLNHQMDKLDLPELGSAPVAGGMAAFDGVLVPLSQVPPQYPQQALNRGIEGWVKLAFVISEDGSVRDVEVLESHPRPGIFDNAARRALARWRFRPKMVDGHAVDSRAEITLNFSLQDGA